MAFVCAGTTLTAAVDTWGRCDAVHRPWILEWDTSWSNLGKQGETRVQKHHDLDQLCPSSAALRTYQLPFSSLPLSPSFPLLSISPCVSVLPFFVSLCSLLTFPFPLLPFPAPFVSLCFWIFCFSILRHWANKINTISKSLGPGKRGPRQQFTGSSETFVLKNSIPVRTPVDDPLVPVPFWDLRTYTIQQVP